jgi:hypothetical protein
VDVSYGRKQRDHSLKKLMVQYVLSSSEKELLREVRESL